jgi:hypothetical protein
MASSFWMSGRSAAATSSRCGVSRLRRVSSKYNLPHVLDLDAFAAFAIRVMTARDSDSARSRPTTPRSCGAVAASPCPA